MGPASGRPPCRVRVPRTWAGWRLPELALLLPDHAMQAWRHPQTQFRTAAKSAGGDEPGSEALAAWFDSLNDGPEWEQLLASRASCDIVSFSHFLPHQVGVAWRGQCCRGHVGARAPLERGSSLTAGVAHRRPARPCSPLPLNPRRPCSQRSGICISQTCPRRSAARRWRPAWHACAPTFICSVTPTLLGTPASAARATSRCSRVAVGGCAQRCLEVATPDGHGSAGAGQAGP